MCPSVYITCSGILVKNVKKVYQKLFYSQYEQGVTNPLYKRTKEHHFWNPEAQYSWETREILPYADESSGIRQDNPMPICSYRWMTWGRFIPLKSRLQSHVFFLHKWFCENAVLSLWLCNAPGSAGDSRYNPNAPHFKAPTWLFVFASTLKYWPLLSNCSLGLPTVDPRPTVAQQRVTVTWWTGVTVQPPWKSACSSTQWIVPWRGH